MGITKEIQTTANKKTRRSCVSTFNDGPGRVQDDVDGAPGGRADGN